MMELIAHNLAPIMFITVMAMLLIGYPVAFTLAAGGLGFFVVGVVISENFPNADINLFWNLLNAHPTRNYDIMSNDILLAVPFFTFMGLILERSGMAEDLLDTIGQLFGSVRGGLAYAVVLVGALLAATTGVVAASVIAMGLISLPIMMRYGYNRSLAAGTIAASGTLAQIVPPSLVLIVMADQLGRSVGHMYLGAIVPAGIMIFAYCFYIFVVTLVKPDWAPALPAEARKIQGGATSFLIVAAISIALGLIVFNFVVHEMRSEVRLVWSLTSGALFAFGLASINRIMKLGLLSQMSQQVILVLMPPLALIFLVLGTIFLGIATPTEGGAMGAVGALLMAWGKGRLNGDTLYQALLSTTKLATFVMFILIGARVFSLTFLGLNGDDWIKDLMLQLPGGIYGFLIVVSLLVFVLGMFLDFFEIAFIMIPLLVPVADALGIDLIWFGVILGINLQTSFLTPPFGFALFYLRSVSPKAFWKDEPSGKTLPPVKTVEIYKGAIPFILINIFIIGLVIAFPQMVTHYKGEGISEAAGKVDFEVPSFGGALDGGSLGGDAGALPDFGLPALGGALDAPSFGDTAPAIDNGLGTDPMQLPGLSLDGPPVIGEPAATPDGASNNGGFDLTQPPSFE